MKRRPRPDRTPVQVADAPPPAGRRPRKAFRLAIAAALAAAVVVAVVLMVPAAREGSGPEDTPEGALRAFFLASAFGDEAALRDLTLPTPRFDLLLQGKRVPAAKADEFRRSIARMTMKRIKPGAMMKLPNGRIFEVDPGYPIRERAWIMPEGTAYPTELRRVGGTWKVDASKIIAAREAEADARRADEARRRAGH